MTGGPHPGGIVATLFAVALVAAAGGAAAEERTLLRLDAALLETLASQRTAWGGTIRPLGGSGGYTIARVSLPAAADIPPHPHPAGKAALVTVLRGSFEVALGGQFDPARLVRIPPGETVMFRVDDPHHFARTGPEGVELLLVAVPPDAVVPELATR